MTILFMYDSPLLPEKGGTERATKLVMDELARRGHTTIGLLHFNQENPDEYFLNGKKIDSLIVFLKDNHVDVVVNQIAFHYWLLKEFLAHGGQKWKDDGGKVISFMHFDTEVWYTPVRALFRDFSSKDIIHKIKRIGYFILTPKVRYLQKQNHIYSLRYLYENSDSYVVMSKSYIDTFERLTGIKPAIKACVITNMLTFPVIADENIILEKEKIALVVARLDDNQKRISFIIKAWSSIIDHHGYNLYIIGTGPDEAYLKKLASGCKNIIFKGQQTPYKWYCKARIFLLASPREGWGLTLTESLQTGVVPIVMNTSKVFHDIIVDKETGFISNNLNEYIHNLKLLLSDDKLRNRMAIRGLQSSIKFSSKIIGDSWELMINEIMRNK